MQANHLSDSPPTEPPANAEFQPARDLKGTQVATQGISSFGFSRYSLISLGSSNRPDPISDHHQRGRGQSENLVSPGELLRGAWSASDPLSAGLQETCRRGNSYR